VSRDSSAEFWGLDLETSGTTHERHAPIQLGLSAPTGEVKSWLINAWAWDGKVAGEDHWLWDERAFEVHGITKERLQEEGSSIPRVTLEAVSFIEAHSDVWHGSRKLVGWNVGSFDVPFVRKHLPGVASVLSYQSADLNAVCFAISEAQQLSYSDLKAEAKAYAAEKCFDAGLKESWHDAGYDALASLYAWDYLVSRVRNGY
jgi:DNA polymerase III epsilon subunit-like protein